MNRAVNLPRARDEFSMACGLKRFGTRLATLHVSRLEERKKEKKEAGHEDESESHADVDRGSRNVGRRGLRAGQSHCEHTVCVSNQRIGNGGRQLLRQSDDAKEWNSGDARSESRDWR